MPPSTATQVETLRLTLSTVYSVTPAFAQSARPGSISRRLPGASIPCSRAAARSVPTYSSIAGGRCWDSV